MAKYTVDELEKQAHATLETVKGKSRDKLMDWPGGMSPAGKLYVENVRHMAKKVLWLCAKIRKLEK